MKKTNRTDDELVSGSLLIAIGVMFWIVLFLEIIGAVITTIIFAISYTIINILFWNNMFKGKPCKIVWGSSIMEIALILPIIIIFAVKGLL